MQAIDKINRLKKINKSFFTNEDLQKIFKLKKSSLKKVLWRMVQKELLKRLCRDVYVLPEQGIDIKKIASKLYSPYGYISFESALSSYGIINQIPYAVTIATYKSPKVRPFFTSEIILRRIKKELFFGYKLLGGALIAEPEKALLDTIYLKTKGLASLPEEELNLKGISKKRFFQMSRKFPANVQKEARRVINSIAT
jgi:predicted transcriptional regulator of viral defense system